MILLRCYFFSLFFMAVHTGLLYTVLPLALVFGYLSTVLETLESYNDLDRTG